MTAEPFLDLVEGKADDLGVDFKNKGEIKLYVKDLVEKWTDSSRKLGRPPSKRNQEAVLYDWLKTEGADRFEGRVEKDNEKYLNDTSVSIKDFSLSKLSEFEFDRDYEKDTISKLEDSFKEAVAVELDDFKISDLRISGSLSFKESFVQELYDNRVFNFTMSIARELRDANDTAGLSDLQRDVENTKYGSELLKEISSMIERIRG